MTKETLERCRAYKYEIETKEEERERLRSEIERVTQVLSMTPGGGRNADKMTSQMAKLLELECDLMTDIITRSAYVRQIDQWLETLQPEERMIMRLRYVDGLSWGQVERKAGYSDSANGKTAWAIQKRIFKKMP